MRRRNYCRTRSSSVRCPPGCCLPCCVPRRRRRSPRVNRCLFIPPPGLSTKRYCGDPCSPPPPACTPKPPFKSTCRRPQRPSMCSDPCTPRPRPLSCSPRSYSRPFRRMSRLYSSTNPCRPKKCGPLGPCVPSLTRRLDPCPFSLSLCDPCCPRLTSPCCYDAPKSKRSSCKPRRSRRSTSPKCRPGRSKSRRLSSCGSSYCESPCSKGSASKRCKTCGYEPCCCKKKLDGGHEEQVNCPEDASKGPTSWFLKKSEKCGKTKKANESHFCPWEAEVTVTGTVRGHCTSTAVEVAKRLTGKFSSRGQRYTTCKKNSKSCKTVQEKCRPQKMALGYLDDGTKLDFSRNKCEDYDEGAVESKERYLNGRTNNANTEETATASRWRSSRDGVKGSERKYSGRGDLGFATAYIGRRRDEFNDDYTNFEEIHRNEVYPTSQRGHYRAPELTEPYSRHGHHSRHRHRRAQIYPAASDSDHSSYKTASGSMEYSRRYPNSSRDPGNVLYTRRKGRRKDVDLFTGNSSGRREAWWGRHNYHRTSFDDNCYYDDEEEEDAERDVINFKLVSDDDDDDDDDGNDEDYCNNRINESDNDDIDKVNPHPSPTPRRLDVDRAARSSDRRSLSPATYSRRSNWFQEQRRHTHHPRVSGAAKHRPDLADSDVDGSSRQSSDGEWEGGRSSNAFYSKAREKQKGELVHQSKHLNHRKRVSYGEGL